jgi:transposase
MRGEGRCLFSSSQRRNPPRNALALSPARQSLGRSFSFLTLPPPRTTSSGWRAPIRRHRQSWWSRDANRHRVVLPVSSELLDSGDHPFGRQRRPEGNLRDSVCPVARIFTWVPPTSITSTFIMKPLELPKSRPPYPAEYRRRIVELARAGRSFADLAREFEPTENCMLNWVKQADLDNGRRHDGLTTDEREELNRLRRETGSTPGRRSSS